MGKATLAGQWIESQLEESGELSHLGVRLGVIDFTRATEQVAVLLALAAGRRLVSATEYRIWATRYLLGYLRSSFCKPKFPYRACEAEGEFTNLNVQWNRSLRDLRHDKQMIMAAGVASPWRLDASRYRGLPVPASLKGVELDVLAVPLDGANNLYSGSPGSISVIAAGEPDCFVGGHFTDEGARRNVPPDPLACHYFVVVANRYSAQAPWTHAAGPKGQATVLDRFWSSPKGDKQCFAPPTGSPTTSAFVEQAIRRLPWGEDSGRRCGPTLAWIEPPDSLKLPRPEAIVSRRFESLSGSGIAGAIAALRPSHQIDLACFYAKPHHVIAIAVAAKVLKGSLFAIPVEDDGSVRHRPRVRTADDFVRKRRAFLVATGITRTRALEPVRFLREQRVLVQSMTLSLATGSVRDLHHDFHLNEVLFRDEKGASCRASTLVKSFVDKELKGMGVQPALSGPGPSGSESSQLSVAKSGRLTH